MHEIKRIVSSDLYEVTSETNFKEKASVAWQELMPKVLAYSTIQKTTSTSLQSLFEKHAEEKKILNGII